MNITDKLKYKLALGLLYAAVVVWSLTLTAYYRNYHQSLRFRLLASRLAPSSVQSKRFNAIANAVLKGQTHYSFQSNRLPISGK